MVTTKGELRSQAIEEYWINQLMGDLTNFDLPRKLNDSGKSEYRIAFPNELLERLQHTAKQSSLGVYILLMAGLSSVMCKYTGFKDVVIGMNSINAKSSNMMFAKLSSSFDTRFKEHIKIVKQKIMEAMNYQDCSMSKVLEKVRLRSNYGIHGLFNIALYSSSLQDADSYSEEFDLTIIFDEDNRSFIIRDRNLQYSSTMINRFIVHLIHFLENALNSPDMIIGEIEMISETEKNDIIFGLNSTQTEFPNTLTASQLFEKQVDRSPNKIAVTCDDTSLSYKELNEKANQFAGLLIECGIKPNCLIPILSERSIDMLVSILGIFKAGGAYVPLDPEFPDERIKNIIESSQSSLLLVSNAAKLKYAKLLEKLEEESDLEKIIDIEYLRSTSSKQHSEFDLYSRENRTCVNSPSDIAYVIYTSGTTGRPKGVMIEHVGMINHIYAKIQESLLGPESIVAQNASHCFDISVWQFLSALFVGGRTIIYKENLILNPVKFAQKVYKDNVTVLELVPSYLSKVLDMIESGGCQSGSFEKIQDLYVTGEALQSNLVERWFNSFPEIPLINAYGPTEASDDITHNKILGKPQGTIVSIGKPLSNFHIYIVNEHMQLSPLGMIGEICVSGIGVGRGYYNDPERSKLSFLNDPFVQSEKRRMYKTGDIGRFMDDGSIQYLGRQDQQIKIRGYRIELIEIEQALLKLESIKEGVVLIREEEPGNKYLCAFFVSDEILKSEDIKSKLQQVLPGYMIPTEYHQVSSFPLTPNGKIDRKSLLATKTVTKTAISLPKTETEKRMLQLWENVLKPKQPFSMDIAFFEAGGHSIRAMELAFNVEKEFNLNIPMVKILNNPTIRELCEIIDSVEPRLETEATNTVASLSYPASSAQQRLYMLHEMARENLSYNLPSFYQYKGEFHREQFIKAIELLLIRHESLRTTFLIREQELLQKINENIDINSYFQEKHISSDTLYQEMQQFIRNFDLIEGPLFRIQLVHCEHRHYIFLDMHHIVTDGISSNIIIRDFISLFAEEKLPSLIYQYKDYTAWQKEFLNSPSFRVQEQYWLEQFIGEIPLLNLPTDNQRPAINDYKGASIEIELDSELMEELQQIAVANNTTLYTVMMTLYYVLLFRYTSQTDIVVGSPVSGRTNRKFENVVGMFVNTIPLRSRPESHKTFLQFLGEVKSIILESFSNQEYPFEKLTEYNKYRDLGRNPFFDTMFSWQVDNEGEDLTLISEFVNISQKSNTAKFDISLLATKSTRGIRCIFEYRTQLFTEKTIQNFALHFRKLAYSVVQSPTMPISKLDMLSIEEHFKLINSPEITRESDTMVHELFMNQATSNPSKIAVVNDNSVLSYKELQGKVNLYAQILREKGVTRGDIVGVIGKHSIELLAYILAILQAGGAYLPIDASLPSTRINDMLLDSKVRILLTEKNTIDHLDFNGEILHLKEECLHGVYGEQVENINQPSDLAYVIYTSGSTGKPKGVMITHSALSNYISFANQMYVQGRQVSFALYSSLSFDLTVTSIFVPLISGNKIVIYSDSSNELLIRRIFTEQKANVIKLTPAHLELVKDLKFTSCSEVKILIVGGDDLKSDIANQIYTNNSGQVEIYNEYGPTEATVGCMVHKFDPDKDFDSSVPIGVPIKGTQIYILDQSLSPSPVGVPGEIYIAGKGLSLGYLNQRTLTDSVFIDSPFYKRQKLYKTGDIAKRDLNGNIRYLGRLDEQVKIRGYRIELQEIENHMKLYKGINEAIVRSRVDKQGNNYLCAYYTVKQHNKEVLADDIKLYLSGILPNYMIPSYIIEIDKVPINTNGKIDKYSLPSPSTIKNEAKIIRPAKGDTELKLLEVWESVFEIKRISVEDNFFEIGGHSLLLLHLHKEMEKTFSKSIAITDLFAYPTIAKMARYLDKNFKVHSLIKGMKIKNSYFIINENQYKITLESSIENKAFQLIKTVSNNNELEVIDFLMASLLLTLANIVEEDNVCLHTIQKTTNEAKMIKASLPELEDINTLFNIVKSSQGFNEQYDLKDIDSSNISMGYGTSSVLFYQQDCLTSDVVSTIYGIAIAIKEEGSKINITWDYNEKRLNQLKMQELFRMFIRNCEKLAIQLKD